MYNHLRGLLVEKHAMRVVLETGGIGWELTVPLSTSQALGKPGAEATLLTHLVVREDDMHLIGFSSENERQLFRTLIGISGVGPALALQILSAVSPQDFAVAVERQDAGFLKKIKGIGEKTAKRIILELKGAKMLLSAGDDATPSLAGTSADAVAALETMGMQQREAVARVERVVAEHGELPLEDLIRKALH